MRRISLALAFAAALTAVGCGGGETTEEGSAPLLGVLGKYYFVSMSQPPIGGYVSSSNGALLCGASSRTVSGSQYVYTYYSTPSGVANKCTNAKVTWGQSVVLTAVGQGGNVLIAWGGSCGGTGTCTLTSGADKSVNATFGPGNSGHPNYTSAAVHGPAYFAFLSGQSTLNCATCHGATLNGQGIAPSCNACHATAGWTGWQSNCSFCHGAKTSAAKAGYAFSAHPEWSAPPDAISQRNTGIAAPDRTGAHQAHLLGVTPGGLAVGAFGCVTCHPVPTSLTHISGQAARANVVLSNASAPSLPAALGTYDQATGTCTTYCHGSSPSPAWASTGMACSGCHGTPPGGIHPNVGSDLTLCALCHAGSVNPDGTIKAGGQHLDGTLQATGGHLAGYAAPAVHGPDALAGLASCRGCHGATLDGALGPSCNACHASAGWTGWQSNCSFCHGARTPAAKAGYSIASSPTLSAPPDAVAQRLDPAHAAVPDRTGAHQLHLTGSAFALPFSCATCHAVPADLTHVDGSGARAVVTLSAAGQASLPADMGSYSQASGNCTTYCHGSAPSPAWSSTSIACGSCHALPPSTASGHPNVAPVLTGCYLCHGDTMDASGALKVSGGKHVNGVVEATGHGNWTSPAIHGPQFFLFLNGGSTLDCKACHGASYEGGIGPSCNNCHAAAGWSGWQANCSFCHGATTPAAKAGYSVALFPTLSAPPDAIAQRLDPAHAAVPARTGAHQIHLTGGPLGPAFSCATCHAVPADLSHVDGGGARAVVTMSNAGQFPLPTNMGSYDQASGTCATYCHGAAPSPAWSAAGGVTCGTCHALPPSTASGHPNVPANLLYCYICHPGSVNADGTIKAGGTHLDGVKDSSGMHGDYSSPATHGPRFFDYLVGAGTLDCKACHGATYDGGGVGPSCNACHQAAGWTGNWQANCSFCHGARNASTQAGYSLASHPTWSAPPDAISQRLTGVAAPARTGAHQIHMTGSAFAGAFSCATCHPVPSDLSHISGSAARANVVLSGAGQASLPASLGTYNQSAGTCATYCHGSGGSPAWSATGMACDGCHGTPPATSTGHPGVTGGLTACAGCHPDTMNSDGTLNLAGGKHLNGNVEASGHGDFSSPATHGPQFFAYLRGDAGALTCTGCHGATLGGGSGPSCNACHLSNGWTGNWQTNCSFCHGAKNATTKAGYTLASHPTWSAPPDALSQRLTGVAVPARTGAHQVHLTGSAISGAFTCATCHAVPTTMAHAGGPGRAPVVLSGLNQLFLPSNLGSYSPATGNCTTYCHVNTPVSWTGPAQTCTSCHGYPSPTGMHDLHVNDLGYWCADCHAATVSFPTTQLPFGTILGNHVDGTTNVQFYLPGATFWDGASCTSACHDSSDWRSWR